MALTNEDLQAISSLLEPIHNKLGEMGNRLDEIDNRLDKMGNRLDEVDNRLDKMEKQIKRTERNLKAEIVESENLILQEVDDVHRLLIKHENDSTKHIA